MIQHSFKTEFNMRSYKKLGSCFLAAVLLNLLMEILLRRSLDDTVSFVVGKPLTFFYGCYLVFATQSLCFLTRRRGYSFGLISAVWLGVSATNFILQSYRSMPLTASDIWLMSSVRDIFEKYLSHGFLILLMLAISLLIGGLLYQWLQARKYPKLYWFGSAHVALIWLVLMLFTNVFTTYGIVDSTLKFNSLPEAYDSNGFSYCFAASLVTGGVDEPEDYSSAEVESLIDIQKELPETEKDTPNIVFVQLESFFDATYMQELTPESDPIPNFRRLKEAYPSGLLAVPCVGAGTANTEFEVLTGMNLTHFGVGEYPYMTIVSSESAESVANSLREIGYRTHGIHNNNATFYDRHIVYQNLGFETFTSLEYMENVELNPLGWAKDRVLTEEIMKNLQSTEEKDFIFTVSVQPHGKYPKQPLEGVETEKVLGIEDKARHSGFAYYLTQLRECDAFVGALVERLSRFNENTVVVFYGDHLPSFNIRQEELSYGDPQTTEYVIWSNFPMKAEDRNFQTYQLSAYVLELCGIYEGAVFRLHQSYDYASEENEAYQESLQILEYDMIYGEQYYNDGNPRPQEIVLRFDVEDILLHEVEVAPDRVVVSGERFTPYSVVCLNNVAVDTVYISDTELHLLGVELIDGDLVSVAQVSAADGITVLSQTDALKYESEDKENDGAGEDTVGILSGSVRNGGSGN